MATPTLKDIAASIGMSESSVSRILNGKPGYKYSEETRQCVLDAVERMGYQANTAARILSRQKSNLVGLVLRLTAQPYLNRLQMAVRDELLMRGYESALIEPSQLADAENRTPFPSLNMLAGVLSLDLSTGQAGAEHYARLRGHLPIVCLYPTDEPDLDWVYTDSSMGVELAVDHLVALGHRRIAFLGNPDSPSRTDHLKLAGWQRAVSKHGIPIEDQVIISPGLGGDVESRADVIVAKLSALSPKATSLVCGSDESALCVMARLQALGWDIPRDLSITGYDGIAFGAYVHPGLTTVVQPVHAIAAAGVSRLLEIIERNQEQISPQVQLMKPQLLIRNSTARPLEKPAES